jgi:hypothetical protein
MSERRSLSLSEDWWRVAGVVALGALLSVIGFNVASTLEPSGSPSPVAAADDTTTTSNPTSTSQPATETTGDAAATTAPSVASGPAALALSSPEVDLSDGASAAALDIVHTAGGPADWSLSSDHSGVTVTPSEGRMGPGESVSVEVDLDRDQVEEGELSSTLTLTWDAGEASARVTARLADNPIIHNPAASPASVTVDDAGNCSPTQTTVSARVRDTSELDRVIARWSPDGSSTRETVMRPVGEDVYEGSIGPYETVRTDSVKVVAYDIFENAGGASISVVVEACPTDS